MTRRQPVIAQSSDVRTALGGCDACASKQHPAEDCIAAWRAACAVLQLQLSEQQGSFSAELDQVCRLLQAVQRCATSCLAGQSDLQFHHAALMYQYVKRLHERQAFAALCPLAQALLVFLGREAVSSLQDRCSSIRAGCISACIAAMPHAADVRAVFRALAAPVSADSASTTPAGWQLAHRLVAMRVRIKDVSMSTAELQAALALLVACSDSQERQAAEKVLPHLIAAASPEALLHAVDASMSSANVSTWHSLACKLAVKRLLQQSADHLPRSDSSCTTPLQLWMSVAVSLATGSRQGEAGSGGEYDPACQHVAMDSASFVDMLQSLATDSNPLAATVVTCCLQSMSRSLHQIAQSSGPAGGGAAMLLNAQLAVSAVLTAVPELAASASPDETLCSALAVSAAAFQLAQQHVCDIDGTSAAPDAVSSMLQLADDVAQGLKHASAEPEWLLDDNTIAAVRWAPDPS